ncbi:hypothetical protein OG379_14850 [Streptomyces sp. NBC_01166]|uniref:hypothetical protein n=1 Tax=Streptomyces sp. NBC_01166 TaxID=2903755 RepID=UPI003870562F|nr:hypothetical protein OG379_14850 [Streptomyces sp. NBC_01166]
MDVPSLILLGAAGGLLRGALDLYTRFVSWQADRRAHRQSAAADAAQEEAPRFQAYFDPAVDTVAAVVHSVMGAGAAVLFGTTGQISGGYAALVVGLSAPMLLTQLGRIQTVNEAVTGERQPAEAVPEPGALSPVGADGRGMGGADDSGAEQAPSAVSARAPSAHPSQVLRPPARPVSSPRPAAAVTDAGSPGHAGGEPTADRTPFPERARETPFPASAEASEGAGSGFDGRGAPRWRQGPATGEEEL